MTLMREKLPYSELTFLRIVISLQLNTWRMIFSENRYPLLARTARRDHALAAGPVRLALVDEGAHACAKILAAVAGAHQIVVARQAGMQQAADRFLRHPHGDRRIVDEAIAELGDAAVERVRRDDLDQETAAQRLFGRDQLGQQQHALGAG